MGEWHLGIVGDVLASKLFLCAPREHRRGNIKSLVHAVAVSDGAD